MTTKAYLCMRATVGLFLVAAGVGLVMLSTQWGSEPGTTAVFVMPGSNPPKGLYLAQWVSRPTFGFALGVAAPLVCTSMGLWVLARLRAS